MSRHRKAGALEDTEEFIREWWAEHGFGPSLRDIQDGLGVSSTSVVHYRLAALRQQNRIDFENGMARTIRVKEGATA